LRINVSKSDQMIASAFLASKSTEYAKSNWIQDTNKHVVDHTLRGLANTASKRYRAIIACMLLSRFWPSYHELRKIPDSQIVLKIRRVSKAESGKVQKARVYATFSLCEKLPGTFYVPRQRSGRDRGQQLIVPSDGQCKPEVQIDR